MMTADRKIEGSFNPACMWEEVEGVFLPTGMLINRPLKNHIECLKALEMRPDDVILTAFPKAGTHWIWEVTSMLLAGKAMYDTRVKELTMMETTDIEQLDILPSPRVLNTHLPLRLLPRQIKEKKLKVIHIYRNFKDVLVSGYFHFRQVPFLGIVTMENMIEMFCAGDVPGYKFVEFMMEIDDYHKTNPEDPFFLTSFEDAKEDPETMIQNLAEFLGVEASPQLFQDIIEATNLEQMKEADKTKEQAVFSIANIYRKGEVGDWKNHLTVAQSERLDAEVTQLKSCDYHFRYTL
ncbi:sulfotransferase 1A2-like [Babylonia areolata]|uniref:sulfotransferase 1A2-like n=1 Tax=Babylonia areolata TaxID=304850 RepID=UPI003FD0A6CB